MYFIKYISKSVRWQPIHAISTVMTTITWPRWPSMRPRRTRKQFRCQPMCLVCPIHMPGCCIVSMAFRLSLRWVLRKCDHLKHIKNGNMFFSGTWFARTAFGGRLFKQLFRWANVWERWVWASCPINTVARTSSGSGPYSIHLGAFWWPLRLGIGHFWLDELVWDYRRLVCFIQR